jgi:hypothetical protein
MAAMAAARQAMWLQGLASMLIGGKPEQVALYYAANKSTIE